MAQTSIAIRLNTLSDIWARVGNSAIETLPMGTAVWHSGHIPSMTDMDDKRALWTTRSEAHNSDYVGTARETAKWRNAQPTRLALETVRTLNCADFNSASLHNFTMEQCDCNHDLMKQSVRAWCVENGFDAIVRLNSDPTEVVFAYPRSSLRLMAALAL